MDKLRLYSKAYRLLENSTPLKMDCGKLCGKACCKGDEELGMYLFPDEDVMFTPLPGFISIKSTNLPTPEKQEVLLAVCKGSCPRNLRPLSCRIFPMVPYINHYGILSVEMDPRARHLCPLAAYSDASKPDRFFAGKVRDAFRLLISDSEIKAFVVWLSRQLDDYLQLQAIF